MSVRSNGFPQSDSAALQLNGFKSVHTGKINMPVGDKEIQV